MQVDTFTSRQLLSGGQLPEALKQLSNSALPGQFRNELILLNGQWEDSDRNFGQNLIDYEQHSRDRSRLMVGLLNLIDRMEQDFFSDSARDNQLYFFESSGVITPKAERTYTNVFEKQSSRYIYWEFRLIHGAVAGQLDFDFSYEMYRPDNSLMTQHESRRTIEQGWANAYFSNGWGKETPGSFAPGKYTVKNFLNGKLVAEGSFKIS